MNIAGVNCNSFHIKRGLLAIMSEIFDFSTIMILAVAVFVLLRLRSVLGQRTGYQAPPPDLEKRKKMAEQDADSADNVVPISGKKDVKRVKPAEDSSIKAINAYAKSGTKLNKGLRQILQSDPTFAPLNFISGGKMAYEMIVSAFADGDTKTLKNLLSKEVYDGFAGAIKERNTAGQTVQSTFVGIESADIKAAEVAEGDANVTVQFISQIISATTDKSGELIDGNPDEVVEVNDIWTFSRSTKSKDPNWRLVATESDD